MHHRVKFRHTVARLKLIKARIGGECVEHFATIGHVNLQVVDARMIERYQIGVQNAVPLVQKVRHHMPSRFARSACEKNAHLVSSS